MRRSVTYILWSSYFASYLEDYLMEKCYTWDIGSVWLKDRPRKAYMSQWPIFHGPSILPDIIVIDLNYLYTLRNGTGRGIRAPPGTCSSFLEIYNFKQGSLKLLKDTDRVW